MRYLTLKEILELHRRIIEHSGGLTGIRDVGMLETASAQPLMTFCGKELCPTIVDKASALGFSLIKNHPFVDGNKRIGHAAMETFLVLNGHEINAPIDVQEQVVLKVAAGELGRGEEKDDSEEQSRGKGFQQSVFHVCSGRTGTSETLGCSCGESSLNNFGKDFQVLLRGRFRPVLRREAQAILKEVEQKQRADAARAVARAAGSQNVRRDAHLLLADDL